MVTNENGIDRLLRGIAGVVLLAAWVFGWAGGVFAIVLAIVGAVLLATAAIGFCPLYRMLGIRTTRPERG